MKNSLKPTFEYEEHAWKEHKYIIGIDEVGRGCMAGPITVAGVCLGIPSADEKIFWQNLGLHDSKKLSAQKRQSLQPIIQDRCLCYSIRSSDVEIINTKGIVPAFQQAVQTIVKDICEQLPKNAEIIAFIDGFTVPNITITQQAIIKGDQTSISIAAASIIAKVHRDRYMQEISLQKDYTIYDWAINKGYGTLKHRQAIKEYGPSNQHRTLFIRNTVTTI